MQEYRKTELTHFAKRCSTGLTQMLNGIIAAEDVAKSDIGRSVLYEQDETLLLEISKRFAKYTKDTSAFDVDTGEVQEFQEIIGKIVECCDENNWFNSN